ncbi:Het-C-domain-containing protein [Fomitiporia mediterranea MF3/22]|uniref:Het-C-domain-containing protein n=1 Tax=Fomitiporia mediterranea (strain MF3/22) TaxID=694068 RepID=UPI0004408A45|nr:Het-C-domain-containing protein [Fomitiporia mediterranea MF3/22]EJC98232.1 Het-C-domain-containing protein [Fomitiporia mediterranea MF3/22]
MPSNLTILFLLVFVLAVCLPGHGVYAFGAGNIPSFAYMEGRAFRHGDIEDVLAEIAKKSGAGIMGALAGRSKFGGLDIKRIYFGNWLRDYSQAVDIAGLKKLPLQTIINLCMALGFLAHGYATNEFEVTEDRLGVYLPTEHIDNPKGYGEGEDARKYHPKLRGPVDPRELEIDPHTGMKNYIANENGSWDTSKALVRRTLERCIHLGRQYRSSSQKADLYESYRLLGQAMHTLEDFTAHSNFCELVLVSMGHRDVFTHVGDRVRIQAPNGKYVAPLITGTFGGNDFIHSLLGEATDHISQASVSDLNKELEKASARTRSGPGGSNDGGVSVGLLKDLLGKVPFGDDSSSGGDMSRSEMNRGMDDIERIRAGPAAGGKRPEDMSPQELHAVLWRVLTFRDSIVKKIEKTIEKIPGLGPLIEKLMDSISVFIFTTLEPYLKPIMKTATTGLMSASGEVIDSHDQYEVFNDPNASDPTHSFLSKDHFNLILNEPAGKIAMVIVAYTTKLIVKAWGDNSANVHQTTEDILQCMFHPDFHNPNSQIQREMLQKMRDWVQGLGHSQHSVISRLSKENVREHRNIRGKGEGGASSAEGGAAYNAGQNAQHQISGYLNAIPGVSQAQSLLNQVNPSRPGGNNPYGHGFREGSMPGPGSGPGTGFPSAPGLQSSFSEPVPASSTGEAAGYYSGGSAGLGGRHEHGHSYSGSDHHASSTYPGQGQGHHAASYAPPPGPPPSGPPAFHSFPGTSTAPGPGPGRDDYASSGYAPSYSTPPPPPAGQTHSSYGGASSYGGSGGGGMSFPDPDAGGGFSMPGSTPAFPSAPGAPGVPGGPGGPGGPMGFPDANAYAPPPGGGGYYSGPPGGGYPHQHQHQRPPGGW